MKVTSTPRRDTVSLLPETRSPTILTLETADPTAFTGDRTLRSEGGLEVHYRLTLRDGGSGGNEAIVTGEVQTRQGTVRLICRAQAESGEPEHPCLALLATLSEL